MGTTFSVTENDTRDDITIKLQTRQTLVTILNWIQAFCVMYFFFQTLVVGYAIVSTPGGTYAVPHAVWVVAPFLCAFVVAHTTRFEVGLYTDTLNSGLRYTYFVIVICLIANGLALALFIWEWIQGVSNFYTQSYGYLIATVIVTGIIVIVELLLLFAIYVFHRDFDHALEMGWYPMYTAHDPQYKEVKPKMDDQEAMLQSSKQGDFDIQTPLRRTRVQVRKLLK
jgi:hypothetical protein